MGYTHYWGFNKPRGQTAKQLDIKYKRALLDCARIAKRYNEECDLLGIPERRLSGYTAHVAIGAYGGLELNGKQELGHEDFTMREHFSQAMQSGGDFCKTARKPYDVVVTACLAVLKHRLGDAVTVNSDGYASDWDAGVRLAQRILKLKSIRNPITRKLNNE